VVLSAPFRISEWLVLFIIYLLLLSKQHPVLVSSENRKYNDFTCIDKLGFINLLDFISEFVAQANN